MIGKPRALELDSAPGQVLPGWLGLHGGAEEGDIMDDKVLVDVLLTDFRQ